jgi:uncharacterized protein
LVTKTKLIVNLTRGDCVCVSELADGPLTRMRGLMGRRGLPAGEGLLISPAPAIHTAFMRFPIDALFLDRNLRVLDIVERLRPWRVASKRNARAVLELSAGECARRGVEVGDRLELRDRKAVHVRAEPPGRAGDNGAPPDVDDASPADVDGAVPPRPLTVGNAPVLQLRKGQLARLQPLRVLVVSPDRRFRTVMSLLLARRNCSVTTSANGTRVSELVERESVDVVVIDASQLPPIATDGAVATVAGLARPVGVVLVSDGAQSDGDLRAGASHPPVLAKWGPFGELFEAIEWVDERRGTWGDTRARS